MRKISFQKTRILSIDGGGIRGILPGQILVSLEKKLQEKSGDPRARIADHFDLIAGTSTGGILSCMYLCPEEKGSEKARFAANEVVGIYLKYGEDIFDANIWDDIGSGFGLTDEKYPADQLEEVLMDHLEDIELKDLLKPSLIVGYDIKRAKPHFFKQHKAKTGEDPNFFARDIARATSAAPTYFETALIKETKRGGGFYPIIDGGVVANNPALCAYAEARKFSDKPKAEGMLILSIGTGGKPQSYSYNKAKDWGKVGWLSPVLNITLDSSPVISHHVLNQVFDTVEESNRTYFRLEPDLGEASSEMDNASGKNLLRLEKAGKAAAAKFDEQLNKITDYLIQE